MPTRDTAPVGAPCWIDLFTSDPDRSRAFYGDLFGWTTEPLPEAPMPYLIVKNSDGHTNGSMRPVMPPGSPPFWLVYFGIDDVDGGMVKIAELGGSTVAEPMDIGPGGRIAVAQDPQGALFALYAGRFED